MNLSRRMLSLSVPVALLAAPFSTQASAAPPDAGDAVEPAGLEKIFPDLEALYIELHRNPELGGSERKTADTLARRLKALGFDVTTKVGGTGVVGLLRNGPGPTVMVRAELDALPVEEKTGLPYASKATATENGAVVPVMHACGHDLHLAGTIGAATLLARSKPTWRGTLMIVGQPSEETLTGARAMLADGLFTRFPKPDAVFGAHVYSTLPAGKVGIRRGVAQASADTVTMTIYGRGGHGGQPQTTVDPVVLTARIVLALQTIVSREINPLEPAVVTVGSMHAGSRPNIIADQAKLELTVRAHDEKVRRKLLAAIARVARGEAIAADAPREPAIEVTPGTNALVNSAALADRLAPALSRALGAENVIEKEPSMTAEDFSEYSTGGVPIFKLYVGSANPEAFARARAAGTELPSQHSPFFAPDRVPTLTTATHALYTGALELLGRPPTGAGAP